MKSRKWSSADVESIRSMRASGKAWADIAAVFGTTAESVRMQLRHKAGGAPESQGQSTGEGTTFTDSGDTANLDLRMRKRIVTLEDALEVAKVDLSVWRVKDYTINKWEMGFVNIEKEANVIPLWQVKVRLERIHKKCYSDSLPLLFASLKSLPRITTKPPKKMGDRLFVPCLFDVHLGKYAWGLETGTDQDTEIQRLVFRNAVEDLLQLAGGSYGRILLPIGNDFFHVNNWLNTTAKGTHVDHDGRFPKVFDAGCQEVINAINKLLEVAPVDVVWVPGNHDPETSYALSMVVEARFHGVKHITVDRGPSPRKYYRFFKTLLGLTHLSEERTQDLPNLMAQERPQDWAETTTREWLTAHLHHSRRFVTQDTAEKMGVVIRTVRALSGTDSWHHAKGYIGSHRAAESHIYGKEEGHMGHWSVAARA